MITRRKVLEGGVLTALAAALPLARLRRAFAAPPTTFDYYISADGDDNNPGTLSQPWSITALNSKMSLYGGKNIGILGNTSANPRIISAGKVGGVVTTLYSMYQNWVSGGAASILMLNGGSSASAPTYIATCDSTGAYSPRTAVIDAADPSTGNQPTVQAPFIGQVEYQATVQVPNYGNITVDGLVVRNFTFSALQFTGSTNALATNVVIQNCELYNGQNVQSQNNPGAIHFNGLIGAVITNCCVHDLKTNAPGSANQMEAAGVIQFNSQGTTVTNCTFYNCFALSCKDSWQSMDVSYCYCGWGALGSPYSGDPQYSNWGATIQNYISPSGRTVTFHHNIVLGPIFAKGATNDENEGTVLIYNNTFYKPGGIGGKNYGIMVFSDLYPLATGEGGGTFQFYNNLVYAADENYVNGSNAPASFNKMGASTGGTWSTLSKCDYNAYGVGMTFGQGWTAGDYGWPLSKWQGYGYDTHSATLTTSPFTGRPSEPDYTSFAIEGPATTAGVGGVACGAVDGTGRVGCDFSGAPSPEAAKLTVS